MQKTLIQVDNNQPRNIGYSEFLTQSNKKDFKEFDVITATMKEHTKFLAILNKRKDYIDPIMHWWNQGNLKSALYAVSKYPPFALGHSPFHTHRLKDNTTINDIV